MRPTRGPVFTHRALVAALAALAFACGGLTVAWRAEHRRAECWRAVAEEDVAQPEGDCRR